MPSRPDGAPPCAPVAHEKAAEGRHRPSGFFVLGRPGGRLVRSAIRGRHSAGVTTLPVSKYDFRLVSNRSSMPMRVS